MKDGYSFHTDEDSLKQTYQDMHQAYSNMLRRSGLAFRAVDADPGAIGGSGSQEFMVLADAGEDEVFTPKMVNVEKASLYHQLNHLSLQTMKTGTPGCETIEKLCQFLRCSPPRW